MFWQGTHEKKAVNNIKYNNKCIKSTMCCLIDKLKSVIIGKFLWHKRNEALRDVLLLENNQLWRVNSNSASCWISVDHWLRSFNGTASLCFLPAFGKHFRIRFGFLHTFVTSNLPWHTNSLEATAHNFLWETSKDATNTNMVFFLTLKTVPKAISALHRKKQKAPWARTLCLSVTVQHFCIKQRLKSLYLDLRSVSQQLTFSTAVSRCP